MINFKTKPIEAYRRQGLYLQNVPDKGRGVFCREDIKQDEVIEVTPALLFPEDSVPHLQKTILDDYIFSAAPLSKHLCVWAGIKDPKHAAVVVMGMLSFCNHIADPNAVHTRQEELNTLYFTLKATKPIPKETEIGISYGNMWFMARSDYMKAPDKKDSPKKETDR